MGKRSTDAKSYASDGGFVEDAGPPPKSKKLKAERKRKVEGDDDLAKKGEDGNTVWEISKNRRVGISEFKGKVMVDIREYYEKDGEMLPGKKGISLPVDQYNAFMTFLPELESALLAKGAEVVRPDFNGDGVSKREEAGAGEEEVEEEKAHNDDDDDDESDDE
ncbi:MAG: hypothetical protein Q9163_000370 [Psora crenata]